MWWQGPRWLSSTSETWPREMSNDEAQQPELTLEEGKVSSCLHAHIAHDVFNRFSSLTRLVRVIARCLRFRICLTSVQGRQDQFKAALSSRELNQAFLSCVAWSQAIHLHQELVVLGKDRQLSQNHPLSRLRPFLDANGIMRVGGRLDNSSLPYDQRHPVILTTQCHLSSLIIDWAHRTALHGGSQLTLANVMRKAWIHRGTSQVKAHVRHCITCVRTRARASEQQMGNLPAERVIACRPFSKVGLDYAGPVAVKTTKGRGNRSVEGYIAFFVCLSTKAVHLKLVGDLTTESFIAALRRFAGRRGPPREIWSDNATTFHGADAELRSMLQEAEIAWDVVKGSLATDGIVWHFIPPSSPHFGGLWEAAVKSAKSHIKRVIGPRMLTYEELNTFLVQVEMCMNSRPLTPLTGEVDDLQVLTPGHFLVGTPLNQIPEATRSEHHLNHETHWRLIQAMRDHFWKRWAQEYLHTLHQRSKWTKARDNLQVNDIVFLLDFSNKGDGPWVACSVCILAETDWSA